MEERRIYTQLLREYRENPILWNKNLPEYFNRTRRFDMQCKLAKILRPIVPTADGNYVRKKLARFRSVFVREHQKVVRCRKAGIHYEPYHWSYKELLFLLDSPELACLRIDDRSSSSSEQADVSIAESQSPTPKRAHVRRKASKPKRSDKKRAERLAKSSEPTVQYDNFLELVAIKLKQLTTSQGRLAEKIINDVLFYAETGELTLDQLKSIAETLQKSQIT
ncbi:uncharacterized protein LOC131287834 [Anopheles ziemanni]|uniref:uncharacterized protein LOC131259192 n=1 Tax=Anopheles coustani TaxID=139045 RepID=UPI0026590145|nr:uncharacterized protein LOC131259192 [Anopheles coustani]XP_058172903.1 uncharacterized protein LOC131287834 [Anopheles ziemanni]